MVIVDLSCPIHQGKCVESISVVGAPIGQFLLLCNDEVNAFFSIYLIRLAALGPGVHLAPNRNEYQKQKNNVSGE
jgi:hypothetical protein